MELPCKTCHSNFLINFRDKKCNVCNDHSCWELQRTNNMKTALKNSMILYKNAKEAKVGDTVRCSTCGKAFIKTHYQQAFCGTSGKKNNKGKRTLCKDQYWNAVRFDSGNISDARRRYLESEHEHDHPYSSDGLGDALGQD